MVVVRYSKMMAITVSWVAIASAAGFWWVLMKAWHIWIEQAYRLQLLKIAVHLASVDRDRNDALAVLCLRFDAAANQLSHGRHRLRVI
jgi:hypothetical protein